MENINVERICNIDCQCVPPSSKQVPLAIMEAEGESTNNVELYWNLFKEVLGKVSGETLSAGAAIWQSYLVSKRFTVTTAASKHVNFT